MAKRVRRMLLCVTATSMVAMNGCKHDEQTPLMGSVSRVPPDAGMHAIGEVASPGDSSDAGSFKVGKLAAPETSDAGFDYAVGKVAVPHPVGTIAMPIDASAPTAASAAHVRPMNPGKVAHPPDGFPLGELATSPDRK